MQGLEKTKILFIAGFGPIVRHIEASRKLYVRPLRFHSKRRVAAISIRMLFRAQRSSPFGHFHKLPSLVLETAPGRIVCRRPTLGLSSMFDSVERTTAELESMGYQMLIKNKKEPWGQTVSRFLDSDGLLVGLTFTPSMREKKVAQFVKNNLIES